MKNFDQIAIDGPAASGKSTLAERLAEYLGYLYFDTGVMYRAVTLASLRRLKGVGDEGAVSSLAEEIQIDVRPPSRADRKYDVFLDGEDVTSEIRTPEVDRNVSQVSAYSRVRLAMTEQQRRIGARGSVVMVGRDIGTVVLPDAGYKIYLEASAEVRARRRYEERLQRGENALYEDVLAAIRQRDEVDAGRDVAPMVPAEDARIIDSDTLSIEEVYHLVLQLLN